MKTTIYNTTTLPDDFSDMREIAINAMEEGDYMSGYGRSVFGWETFSEPGDAILAMETGYCNATAILAHNDVLRIIITTME